MTAGAADALPQLRRAFAAASVAHVGIDMQNIYCAPDRPLGVDEAIAVQDIDAMVGRVEIFAAALRGRTRQVWVNHAILAAMTSREPAEQGAAQGFIGMLKDLWRLWTRNADDIARDEMYRIQPAADDTVIGKTEYDAFAGTRLDRVLRAAGADTLVLSGVFRDVCVLETAKAARRRGYAVYVAEDLTEPSSAAAAAAARCARAYARHGVHVVRAADVLALAGG